MPETGTTPATTPTRTLPGIAPQTSPERRYQPDRDHCPGQRVRTTRRIRRIVEP